MKKYITPIINPSNTPLTISTDVQQPRLYL